VRASAAPPHRPGATRLVRSTRAPRRGDCGAANALAPAALAAFAALLAAGCAANGPAASGAPRERIAAGASPAPVDSATLVLWRFDETGGPRVADAGPLRIEGSAGIDTRTEFGRLRNARLFSASVESFVYAPYRPALDPLAGFTVEAWIHPVAFGPFELTSIAGRWTAQPSEQSWLFGTVGQRLTPIVTGKPSPGIFSAYVSTAASGQLVFLMQPEDAGPPRAFFSAEPVALDRWTHVAVSFDGEVARFYVDGLLDSQHASIGRIRASRAPLMAGNAFDHRALSDFGGELRADGLLDRTAYYAFQGDLDDLRLSTVARTEFPHARYAGGN
jgi:hypothetical protein